jgi:hypothetical protein
MILRRIREHLLEHKWSAIGIDLAVVVLGVFVGIQASNWNQERTTDEAADIFAERLKADMREEHWGYQLLIVYNREVLANAERAVNALDGTAMISDEDLLVSAYRATQYKQRLRRRSTYDEMISTGNIGLIRDQALRDTAMRLYNISTLENLVREGMLSRYREEFRMTLPNEVQRVLGQQCGDRYIETGDYAGIEGVLEYRCTTGLTAQATGEAATALRSNSNLVPLLRLRIADIETRLVDLTINNRTLLDRLNAVANEKP